MLLAFGTLETSFGSFYNRLRLALKIWGRRSDGAPQEFPLLAADLFEPAMKTGRQVIHQFRMLMPQVGHLAGILVQVGQEDGIVAGHFPAGGSAVVQHPVENQFPLAAACRELAVLRPKELRMR